MARDYDGQGVPLHPSHRRIEALAKTRGYQTPWRWGEAPWLLWTPGVERVGSYELDSLFKPLVLFQHKPSDPYPHLQLYTPPDRIGTEAFERTQELYQATANRITGTYKDNLLGALPELNGVLQGAYTLLDRIEPRLRGAFEGGRRVLKAWVVETERALLEEGKAKLLIEKVRGVDGLAGRSDDELTTAQRLSRKIRLDRAMRHGGAGMLYEHAELFWGYLTRGGMDADGLGRLFVRACEELHTPPLVAEAQTAGLLYYFAPAAPVYAEAWRLNEKRTAYETIRHAILTDQALPTPEAYGEEQRQRADEAVPRTWRDERNEAIREAYPTLKAKHGSEVARDKLAEEHGCSTRTVERALGWG